MVSITKIKWQLILFLSLLSLYNAQRNRGGDTSDRDDDILDMEEVRFNKFYFTSSTVKPRGFKPLKKGDYPIAGLTNVTLRLSDAVSVTTMDDYEVVYNVPNLIRYIGGLPSYPDSNKNAPYWNVRTQFQFLKEIMVFL